MQVDGEIKEGRGKRVGKYKGGGALRILASRLAYFLSRTSRVRRLPSLFRNRLTMRRNNNEFRFSRVQVHARRL